MTDIEQIQEIAYYRWEAAGRPHGRDREFWARAEEEFKSKKDIWNLWEQAAQRLVNEASVV